MYYLFITFVIFLIFVSRNRADLVNVVRTASDRAAELTLNSLTSIDELNNISINNFYSDLDMQGTKIPDRDTTSNVTITNSAATALSPEDNLMVQIITDMEVRLAVEGLDKSEIV